MKTENAWTCDSKLEGFTTTWMEKPIHAGELLELLLDDGSWALGRYEWTYRKQDPPWFYVDTESGDCIHLNPKSSQLRWPKKT